MNNLDFAARDFLDFVQKAPSPAHVAAYCADKLRENGFAELSADEEWEIVPGGRYFTQIFGSALVAFAVGKCRGAMRLAAAHTDFPCLRVKPAAGMEREGYGLINIESYGGLVLRSWLDRPLSLAGKIVTSGNDLFHPQTHLINLSRPLAIIPGLAIHFDHDVNEKGELNCQKDMLPLATMLTTDGNDAIKPNFFLDWLARQVDLSAKEILAYELSFYPTDVGCQFGLTGEFVASPRLDNLTSVWSCLAGICSAEVEAGSRFAVFFDHEEVGSRTKQGAGSLALRQILQMVYRRLGWSAENFYADLTDGFMLSADVAHGLHPNHTDKSDPCVRPILGGGVVLKQAASQSYVGDAEAVAVAKTLAKKYNIACQDFVNRADQKGGSTLGAIATTLLPVRALDIGVPILAMHSAVETMAWSDQLSLNAFVAKFLSAE